MADKLTDTTNDRLREKAISQKRQALEHGGYAPIQHAIYRDMLPAIKAKYDGQTARDCVFLYGYLQAHVNGESVNDAYMWAWPTLDQIVEDTGIYRNRVKRLADILVDEGVMATKKIPWNGHTKKMYLPLYRPSTVSDTD